MKVSVDVFSSLSVAVKGGWKNPSLFLGLWKHLHRRGERKVCPMSVFWDSRQGHDDIAKASPALCLDMPAASKASWDTAIPEAAPAKALWGEQGIGSCQGLGHLPTPAHAGRKLPSPPSTAQPRLAAALSCCAGGRIVFSWERARVVPEHLLRFPELPRSTPSSPSTGEGPAKGPTLGSSGRFWAGGWGTAQAARPSCPLAPHGPGAAGAALRGSAHSHSTAKSAGAQLYGACAKPCVCVRGRTPPDLA